MAYDIEDSIAYSVYSILYYIAEVIEYVKEYSIE